MPTASLEFRLPDEEEEFRAACQGADALSALRNMDRYLRDRIKYASLTDDALLAALQSARDYLRALVPAGVLE